MKKIQNLVDKIDEELEGAKEYAEMYVDYRAKGDNQWAAKFKDMANAELQHALTIHTLATQEIEELSKVFKAPAEMQEKWDKSHKEYVDKAAWIKYMLNLE